MVWSTIPAVHLLQAITPTPPQPVLEAASTLRHRAMVFVYLVCDQSRYTPFDAHYFPGLDTPIARLSEPKNYRDGPDPQGQTVLCAELACWEGDDIWSASDDDLGELVVEALERQGLGRPRLVATETRRLPKVYPVYPVGYRAEVAPAFDWLESQRRLANFGRQGLFVPDNLHHALAMGSAAAMSLQLDGSFDRDRWLASVRGFESHVVED